jgi:hypothetical protein
MLESFHLTPLELAEVNELCDFYSVNNLYDLIHTQQTQIERLQEKLNEYQVRYSSKVRYA